MKISHGFAELEEVRLHYAETGVDNEELVILLHGFPEFWYTWRYQLPEIGQRFHAVAPDLRGYNLSDKPAGKENYRIQHLIKDVVQLAGHFGHERFYLVSHDWGAAVAWSVALAVPDQIKGLMVLNGPHPYIFSKLLETNKTQIENSQYMADFQDESIEETLLADNCDWLWNWTFKKHFDHGQMTEEDRDAYLTAWQKPGALTSMLNYYRSSPLQPRPLDKGAKPLGLEKEPFTVKVPTLVLWGVKDHALIPENIEGIEELVPDLKLIRLPEVTHWVTHEAPERTSAEILTFLEELQKR